MDQDSIFLKSEGDQWFERNREVLASRVKKDPALELMEQYALKPKSVLEIGASNGWRLAHIADKYGTRCVGIDPSKKAVENGTKNFKKIKLMRGLASAIPLRDQFDLVIVSFVLHWVSRQELLRSIAEIDRVLKERGNLIIVDFLPDRPAKTHYHHLKKGMVYTYKQRYPEIFSATGLYRLEAEMVFDHATYSRESNIESGDRCAISLLSKNQSYSDA